MIFQAIDDKEECIGVYAEGKLHFDSFPDPLTHTWKYTGSLKDHTPRSAWIRASGRTLADCCPIEFSEELAAAQNKMRAYIKSFTIAKVDLNDHCVFDLIPHDFLLSFCELKNKITEHVFEAFTEPANYQHLESVQRLLHKIKYQKLNLNSENCRNLFYSSRDRSKANSLIQNYKYIDYNLFGTVTGRLTTNPESFPILTLKKAYRNLLKPNNDLFVSLDYNAAEARTFIELRGVSQPQKDIHQWNIENIFKHEEVTRDEAKTIFFAWLYNPESQQIQSDLYDRQKVLDKWYENGYIKTPYGREIQVEERKALNYVIQSTTADRVLTKAVEIDSFLNGKKSYISHIVHDEIVIDYADEDREIIMQIKNIFEDGYLANIKGGRDYFNLMDLEL
tara:strand:- start:31085 stop:32260 length:1176 start_codon:yes stop_codon:yes gene_type:complete